MLTLICYLASQTLRGTLYIVFMLTLQRLLRKRLSPRVRAILWAPLLFVLFAPNLCVVRVPVSQPVETTVVDALEQTRLAALLDGERDAVARSPLDTEALVETVATPCAASEPATINDDPSRLRLQTRDELSQFPRPEPFFQDASAPFENPESPTSFKISSTATEESETFASARSNEPASPLRFPRPNQSTGPPVSPGPDETFARLNESVSERSPRDASATLPSTPPQPSQPIDRRAGWLAFFQTAALVFAAIWALGLVGAFAYLLRSARVCRRWIRLAAPVEDADVLALYRRCAAALDVPNPPRLATTTDLSTPALLGWRRAVVLIPSEYVDEFTDERLTHILSHELGHFKRGDAATGFVAFLVLAAHWFNPLFWLAARSFFATREEACDALALGSSELTNPNSAAEYARTLCEIAGRRRFVEQAFGAVGFSPTFRSLRRRVETLGRFGTWGRRAAIGCLVSSLVASAFATVRLLPDVKEKKDAKIAEEISVARQRARRLFAQLPPLPQSGVSSVASDDPLAAVDVETLYQDEADRLFFGHSTKERRQYVADAVAKLRSAKARSEAEYYAALGDYLVGESAFFWLLAGVDAPVRDDAVAAAEIPALATGETSADSPKSVSSAELDAALARAEKTADPNFRYLTELHRALADDAKREQPGRYRADYAEPLSAYVCSPFWREQLKSRPCRSLLRELEAGSDFLLEAAAQGNGDAAASLARYIENDVVPDFAPSGFVAEVGRRAGITEDDLKAKTPDERPAAVAKAAFLYALAGAEAGSARAQALVASYYARGFGVERNVAEAFRWGRLFYDADVASGAGFIYVPLTRTLKTIVDPATKRSAIVPQTLAELNVYNVREFRRLAPFVDVCLISANERSNASAPAPGALSRRVFLENGAAALGRDAKPQHWATLLLLAEAALDSEPTPENLALAEKFLRRANLTESRSFFVPKETPDGRVPRLDPDQQRVTPGFVEANERLAEAFENGKFGVKDNEKANRFRFIANEFRQNVHNAVSYSTFNPPAAQESTRVAPAAVSAPSQPFVAPQTPEFEATIAPIFAKLEKTLVDAKNGNADALTARFNEYFDDATDLYPNGRPGAPEVARYKVERLTQEIERLEQTDADAATLERLRKSRDSWRRLADATPVVATNA